jgi:predicted phage terminase large subunit-like protein
MSNELEKKLATALINKEKNFVNDELNIFKKKKPKNEPITQSDVNKLIEFRKSIPQENLALYQKELEKEGAKLNYIDYLSYSLPDFIPTKFHRFLASVIQDVVERVEKGETVRLLLSVPPRVGKSYVFTESLPVWFVGRNPNSMCILTAYNSELAERFGDKNRQKAKKFWKELWDLNISPSQDNKGLFEVKGHRGGIMSVGITGGITGNGGRLIIVDDPYKNGQEAGNPTIRNTVETMFRDSVLTRAEGKGNAIIVIHTRWHDEDLIGRLSKEEGWVVINLPMVADGGFDVLKRAKNEVLVPELGFNAKRVQEIMASVGKRVWNALYQGKPSLENGNIFQRSHFKFYESNTLPAVFDEVSQSWDLSVDNKKTSDFVSGQVWGRKGADHYLLKRIKKRLSFTESVEMIKHITALYPDARRIYVEKRANGGAVIETLSREVGGIVAINPKESKVQRANAVSVYFESGNIYLPSEKIDTNIEDYINEFLRFPNSDFDDEVDSTTQYLNEVRLKNSGKINIGNDIQRINLAFRNGNLKI